MSIAKLCALRSAISFWQLLVVCLLQIVCCIRFLETQVLSEGLCGKVGGFRRGPVKGSFESFSFEGFTAANSNVLQTLLLHLQHRVALVNCLGLKVPSALLLALRAAPPSPMATGEWWGPIPCFAHGHRTMVGVPSGMGGGLW